MARIQAWRDASGPFVVQGTRLSHLMVQDQAAQVQRWEEEVAHWEMSLQDQKHELEAQAQQAANMQDEVLAKQKQLEVSLQ